MSKTREKVLVELFEKAIRLEDCSACTNFSEEDGGECLFGALCEFKPIELPPVESVPARCCGNCK